MTLVITNDPFEEYIQAKIKLMMSQNTSGIKERLEQRNKDFSSIKGILHSGFENKSRLNERYTKINEHNIEN